MDELKKLIQAMAVSNANKVMTVTQLNNDFKYHEGYGIPYQKFGFRQLDEMLLTMPDVVQLIGLGPSALVQPVTTQKSQHIRKMINQQQCNGRKSKTPPRYTTQNKGYAYPQSRQNNSYFSPRYNGSPDIFASREDAIEWSLEASSIGSNNQRTTDGIASNKQAMYMTNAIHSVKHKQETQTVINSVNKEPISSPGIPSNAMTLTDRLPRRNVSSHVKPGSIGKAVVVTVLNPGKIYVHLLYHTEKLQNIGHEIAQTYGELNPHSHWQLAEAMAQEGLCCITRHQNIWCRGIIRGPVVDHHVKLLLVDYGYTLNAALSDIKYMDKKLAASPPQNIRVSLAHVKPMTGQWSKAATSYLSQYTYNKILHMYFVDPNGQDDILDVVFIDTHTSTDVILNSLLVSENYAKWKHSK